MGETQTLVSKCERGERRLDVIEMRANRGTIGVQFVGFMKR
jgi:hypothetical protein